MMNKKDYNEWLGYKIFKLRQTRNTLLRAFLINYIIIFAAWLFSMTPMFDELVRIFIHWPADQMHTYMMDLLGIWKILGVVLFLVPALAMWWEMHACRHYQMEK